MRKRHAFSNFQLFTPHVPALNQCISLDKDTVFFISPEGECFTEHSGGSWPLDLN